MRGMQAKKSKSVNIFFLTTNSKRCNVLIVHNNRQMEFAVLPYKPEDLEERIRQRSSTRDLLLVFLGFILSLFIILMALIIAIIRNDLPLT